MSVVGGSASTGLIARVQNILMKPAAEWDVIDGEPATVGGLYTGYACILAAIPAIASVIGSFFLLEWLGSGLETFELEATAELFCLFVWL